MAKADDIRALAAQRVRELMSKVSGWEQLADVKVGSQSIDLLLKFKMGERPHAIAIGVTSLGQPRQIRETVTRLSEIRREMPEAYPVAVSPYISPQSAALLKRSGLGYLDLSGNCYLSFENVLIEKEGKPNLRPSTRPLKSLFAPRATRVVRVMLVDPQHAWRLEELAKAAEVSLGHAHNVIKRLEELSWVERNGQQRIQLARPGDLLDAWVEAYSYRQSDVQAYFSPERIRRPTCGFRPFTATSRAIPSRWRRPSGCGREKARATSTCSLPTTRASSTPRWPRAASRSFACRSSTPISITTSAEGGSKPLTSGARRWATESQMGGR